MKALYRDRLYTIVDDYDGAQIVVLQWERETPSGKTVPAYREVSYSDPLLIIDPTDSDLGLTDE